VLSTLERHLLRRLLVAFVGATGGACFLFLLAATYRMVESGELSAAQLVRALPLALPFLLPYVIPIAFVMALALVYGRAIAEGEARTLMALGFSRLQLSLPALGLGVGLALVSLLLTTTLVPLCYRLRQQVMANTYLQLAALGSAQHLTLSFPRQRLAVYIRSQEGADLRGVVVSYGGPDLPEHRTLVVVAGQGRVEQSASGQTILRLRGASISWFQCPGEEVWSPDDPLLDQPPLEPIRARFEELSLDAGGLDQPSRLKNAAFSSAELRRRIDRALARLAGGSPDEEARRSASREADGVRRELAERAAMAAAPLVLTVLVLPLLFLLEARSPLVALVSAVAASAALFFVAHILGAFLAERLASPLPIFLSWLTCGGTGLGCATRARVQ